MKDGMLSTIRVMLQGRGAVSAGWIPGCCAVQCFLRHWSSALELSDIYVIQKVAKYLLEYLVLLFRKLMRNICTHTYYMYVDIKSEG